MKTINFNFSDFNLERFIKDYDEKIRLVFGINQSEPLGRIIETLNHNTLEIKFNEEALSKNEMLIGIEKEEIAIFMPLGALGDTNRTTLRLINMIKYKIKEENIGDVFKDSEKFSLAQELLDLGDLNVSSDSSIGIVITKINDKIFMSFGQYECGSCMNVPVLTLKENTGNLSNEIKDYLYKYKN
ncbi:MAG: hypothetical protein ACRCTZ_03565 [Sarcina sp.]